MAVMLPRCAIASALACALAATGCYQSRAAAPTTTSARCAPPVLTNAFRHDRSRLVIRAGAPHHAAADLVLNPGQPAVVHTKLAYGTLSKDLEDEDVLLVFERPDCGATVVARARTDDDGRAALPVPPGALRPGANPFRVVVDGDGTAATGTIYVLPPRTRTVIFDIDGTLTTGDDEIIEQIALGTDPALRPGAVSVARRFASAGYFVVYLTGRPYMLRAGTLEWLARHGLPPGPLFTADSLRAAMPTEAGVGAFKLGVLRALSEGPALDIRFAYGNATTDVCAYARAGIEPVRTFIVGTAPASCEGSPPSRALPSYLDHAPSM